ncbi:MAG: hypothetical protein LBE13_00610 [Bacteroidales bacterium]|nr:hypothetical protein [Bacteroidales bacterium]
MKSVDVSLLDLDLGNFRTIHQKNENAAINTIITISPDRFWALLESILDDGYYPTENIILLRDGKRYTVKEGNRRVAALKIILGFIKNIDIPEVISNKIRSISSNWKKLNSKIPCSMYKVSESQNVDKIIALIHAKGEKAGRDQWTAVAKARHNRNVKKQSEPALDLLEKYVQQGKNLSTNQAESWSGDYPLTVLDEALQKIYPYLQYVSKNDLVRNYPKKHKKIIDDLLYDVGIQNLDFKKIRDGQMFFGVKYGLKIFPKSSSTTTQNVSTTKNQEPVTNNLQVVNISSSLKPVSMASNDPKSVKKTLKSFTPRGNGREKLVTLLNEIKTLRIEQHPHAFCFLLRSMFEISAKAYCDDNKFSSTPKLTKSDGKDKHLVDLLRDITNHMTNNKKDKTKTKELHGAITEIARNDGILSVTSMNQLVHNRKFSISPNDISILFNNIYPLLEEMNK